LGATGPARCRPRSRRPDHHYDSVQIGISVGFTAFALMMVAAAYECRSETGTILAGDTFNSRRMNLIAGAAAVGAVLVTGWDFLNRLLGTVPLTTQQFGLAVLCAIALLVTWEIAKAVARHREPSTNGGT